MRNVIQDDRFNPAIANHVATIAMADYTAFPKTPPIASSIKGSETSDMEGNATRVAPSSIDRWSNFRSCKLLCFIIDHARRRITSMVPKPTMQRNWIDEGGSDVIRLETLKLYEVLDTPNEAEFDEIVAEAVVAMQTPIALISLVDEDRQWFKARIGLNICETDRSGSFCNHTIRESAVFSVPDATNDPRFYQHPAVTGDLGVRFYAGAPLTAPNGMRIGALCVLDTKPRRPLEAHECQKLTELAERVMKALENRKHRVAPLPPISECYGRNR
jgi:hypothetical protein